jgi:hypothetical protein
MPAFSRRAARDGHPTFSSIFSIRSVTPAKAGVHGPARQLHQAWIPAFAGMTAKEFDFQFIHTLIGAKRSH